jgi:hypothetical protein
VFASDTAGAATFSSIDQDTRALAIYANYPRVGDGRTSVRVEARRPDGSRVDLITFHPRPGWARRYWFTEPISLPKGTLIETTTKPDDEIPLLPLSVAPNAAGRTNSSSLQLVLNVVPGR